MTNQNNEKSKNGKRIALILLALLLIAAIAFGAYTYSKYVTSGDGEGSATVAKWGFTITAANGADTDDNNAFGQYYSSSGTEQDSDSGAVIARADSNVVAPGAKGSIKFSVTGSAEVQATLTTVLTLTNDVYITLQDADDSTKIEYHPVLFTLKNGSDVVSGCENVPLAVIAAAIKDDSTTLNQATIAPNPESPLAIYYELSWAWDFESAGTTTLYTNTDGTLTAYETATFGTDAINELDTVLGQLSNGTSLSDITVSDNTAETPNVWNVLTANENSNYSTGINFALAITVTQSGITG